MLRKAHEELHGKGLRILAVSGEPAGELRRFVKERQGKDAALPYAVIADQDGKVLGPYKVRMFPTLVFVDRHGRVRHRAHGFSPLLRFRLRYYVTGSPF